MLVGRSQRVTVTVASAYDAPATAIDSLQPITTAQRIDLLDALRGFALAGVLLANLVAFSLYAFLPSHAMAALATADLDRLLDPALGALVSSKFITLFSLLFGVGFALQIPASGGDPGATRRYLRRLGALFVIGLLHATVFWWGDILRYYAVIGLALLPVRGLSSRRLVTLGTVLIVADPLLAYAFPDAGLRLPSQEQANAAAFAAFASNDWSTLLRGNTWFAQWWVPAHWGTAMSVAGCMLIGTALGRSDVLRNPAAYAWFWQRLLLAFPVGLTLALVVTLAAYGRLPWVEGDTDGTRALLRTVNRVAALILGLGYMAAFVWLYGQRRWRRGLQPLAPVGRMALSNYLAQTLVGIGLFYGVGLGVGPRYGLVGVGVVWAVVFAAQLAISHWWLARFCFGPAEWAWRSATYGRWQPMRR